MDPSLVDVIIVAEEAQRRLLLRDLFQSPRRLSLDVAIAVPDSKVADAASRQLLETDDPAISTYMAEKGVVVGSVNKGEVTVVHITLNVPPSEDATPSAAVETDVVVEKRSNSSVIASGVGGAAGTAVLGGAVIAIIVIRKRNSRRKVVSSDSIQVMALSRLVRLNGDTRFTRFWC